MAALSVVVLLVFVVVGFIRGLQQSLANSGDPRVVLVYSVSAEQNIENSSIAAQMPGILAAEFGGKADAARELASPDKIRTKLAD